ncbi:MAG: DUF4020 domain-containing protein [Desulfobacteraceae bacterium]|nr:MAG: DUF4020 domain-containing protein [Desulfobacteraceae bacterium]
MKIKGIDFPEKLLRDQRQKNLVVFTGAGVSMGPPSKYPDFRGLVKKIAELNYRDGPNEEPPEHFLGRLVNEEKKIHEQVVKLLSSPDSKHNKLHEDLLKLFSNPEQVRIVTTNFDFHFESAAEKVFNQKPEIYRAPALPLGNDFSGIVYLHGSVNGAPRKLVLTDQDFGRAYITEGWATRFLQAMFLHYAVLFVGYSHDDTVMHYLSRGLPPETTKPRFALIRSDENSSQWEYRGITPLPYPHEGRNDYSRLGMAVAGWEQHVNRGNLDTEQRIKDLVISPPPLDEEDQDFLYWAIHDKVANRFFFRHANRIEWLSWINEQKILAPLFAQADLSENTKKLALWISENFVVQNADKVFLLLESNKNLLNPWFGYEIVRQLAYGNPLPDKDIILRWVPILLQNKSVIDPHQYTRLLEHALTQDAFSVAVLLFEYLTKPHAKLVKSLSWGLESSDEGPKADMALEFFGDYHTLNEIWEKLIRPKLPELVTHLWPVVIQNFNQAFQLLKSWNKIHPGWDPLSWSRSAIEPHEQDQYPDTQDILINAARDCLEWLLQNKPQVGLSQIKTLSAMEPLILKRLALHGVSLTSQLKANEKIKWVLEEDFIQTRGLKQEIFQLLKNAYPNADSDLKRALLNTITAKIDALPEKDIEDRKSKEYAKFNFFQWLSHAAPDCREVAARLDLIKKEFPDFQTRDYPGLDHWSHDAHRVGSHSPVSVEDLLKKQPAEWQNLFLTFNGEVSVGSTRNGLLLNVTEAVPQNFNWAKELADLLCEQTKPTADLWESLIRGWNNSKLDPEQWEQVLSILDNLEPAAEHAQSISALLQRGAKKNDEIPLGLLNKADSVAQKVWTTLKDEISGETYDWLMEAINHPGGSLTLFWLHALSRTRRETKQKDKGLIMPYRVRFEEIISKNNEAAILGRVILTNELGFLFTVDPAWTKEKLIPLFDWDKEVQQAEQAWNAWLKSGRINESLLDELIPLFKKSFSHLSTQLQKSRERFAEWVAHIAVFWMDDPLNNNWVPDFLMNIEEQDRINFASRIGRQLKNMESEKKIGLWKRWLKRYWEDRNQGMPVPLADGELVKMMEWIVELEPVFSEVVEVICNGRIPEFKHTSFFSQMANDKATITTVYPTDSARLLVHLTTGNQIPIYFCDNLEKLTEKLI